MVNRETSQLQIRASAPSLQAEFPNITVRLKRTSGRGLFFSLAGEEVQDHVRGASLSGEN